ncbi:MAG TPA: NAD(P)H-hydrate epimerase [bacterium]|nr:NAD(P)H-hydrate epimerase [bacterium]
MKRKSFSRQQIYAIEKRAYEEFLIPPLILMENAGRETASEAKRTLSRLKKKKVIVLAGPGNNGGDGMVAARYLHCWGISSVVFVFFNQSNTKEPSFTNYRILIKIKVKCEPFSVENMAQHLKNSGLIIDALFGIGLTRPIEGREKIAIELANNSRRRILSVDIPSGIDADSGKILSSAVKADTTITFGFPKKGLYKNPGKKYAGKIKIVDIGYPPEIYR